MDYQELKTSREKLELSHAQAADMLEVDVSSVYKWERDPGMASARPAPARVGQLYLAYLSGFRPGSVQGPNWTSYTDIDFPTYEIEIDLSTGASRCRKRGGAREVVPAWQAGWPSDEKGDAK